MGLRKVGPIGSVPDSCGLPVHKLLLNLSPLYMAQKGDLCGNLGALIHRVLTYIWVGLAGRSTTSLLDGCDQFFLLDINYVERISLRNRFRVGKDVYRYQKDCFVIVNHNRDVARWRGEREP